jgi:hypothetical protein
MPPTVKSADVATAPANTFSIAVFASARRGRPAIFIDELDAYDSQSLRQAVCYFSKSKDGGWLFFLCAWRLAESHAFTRSILIYEFNSGFLESSPNSGFVCGRNRNLSI